MLGALAAFAARSVRIWERLTRMSKQVITETVTEKEGGVRLDRWVKRRMPMTQGQVEKLLRTGQIRVDGARAKVQHATGNRNGGTSTAL